MTVKLRLRKRTFGFSSRSFTSKWSGSGGVSYVMCGSAPPLTSVSSSASNVLSSASATFSVS